MKDFKDKTVVITGGASGVGRALGEAFSAEQANVVLVDINAENLDNTVSDIGAENITGITADVTSPESMQALADECFTRFGNVHILINNAGVGLGEAARPIWTLPPKDWEWGFAVNTYGAVNGIRAFLPRMLENNEEGVIVNTSSGNGGMTSLPTTPIYAASKAAMTSLTEVLHFQLIKQQAKIRAAAMFPGPHVVNTGILNSAQSRPEKFSNESSNKPKAYTSFEDLAKSSGVEFELIEPAEVAEYTLRGILNGDFWIFPDDYNKQFEKVSQRTEDILNRRNPEFPEP